MSFEIISTAAGFIQFTDLGVGPVALDLGFFQIRWYSLGYLVGILLGYWMLLKLLARPGAPMSREQADDIILYATLGIILGGRIGYILFYQPSILQNPMDVFKLWEGGIREQRAAAHGVKPEDLEDFYASRNLLNARVRSLDVARAAAFFLSDESSRTTGSVIAVDGGVAAAFPR